MSFAKKIFPAVQILRPLNFLLTFFSVIVSALICMKESHPAYIIISAAFSAAAAASAGNIINDVFDIEIDKLNRPQRTLPSGILSKNSAVALYVSSVLISLVLALVVNITAFITAALANIILYFYSAKLKPVPLLGNIVVAFMTALAFIYGGIAVNNLAFSVIPALFAFLINAVREIVKDMEDVEGDSRKGVYTFPAKYGFDASKTLILFFGIALVAATFYPFIMHYYKIEYLIIVMALVNPLIVFSLRSLYRNHSNKNLKKISFVLKLNMIFGLAAIYLGK